MKHLQLGLRGSPRCHPTLAASKWLACGPRAPRVYHSSIKSRVLAVDVEDAIVESDYAIVTVHLQMIGPTEIGDDLRILGSCQALGQWQPGKALKMQQTTSGVWVADVDLPPGTHEFKAVVYNSRLNRTEVEEDTYRLLQVRADGWRRVIQVPEEPGWLRVDFRWGDNDLITSFLPEPKEDSHLMLEIDAAAWDAAALAVSSAAADSKSVRPPKPPSPSGRPRSKTPSAYNLFIGEAIKRIKEEEPELSNKERMQKALAMWRAKKAAEDAIRGGRKRSPNVAASSQATSTITQERPAGSPPPRVMPSSEGSTLPIPNVYSKAALKKLSAGIGEAPPIEGGPEPQPAAPALAAAAAPAPPGPADPTNPAWLAWAGGVGVVGAAAAALILNATINSNGPNVKKMAARTVTPAKPDSAFVVQEDAGSDADQPAKGAAAASTSGPVDEERPMFMSEREALKDAQRQAEQQQQEQEQGQEPEASAAAVTPPSVFEQLQENLSNFLEQQQQQPEEGDSKPVFSFFEQQNQQPEEPQPAEQDQPEPAYSFFEQQQEQAEEPSSAFAEPQQEEEPVSSFFEQQREELEEPIDMPVESPVSMSAFEAPGAFEEPEPQPISNSYTYDEQEQQPTPAVSTFERMFREEEEQQPAAAVQTEEPVPVFASDPPMTAVVDEEEDYNLPTSLNEIPDVRERVSRLLRDAEPGSLYEQFFGRSQAFQEEEQEKPVAPIAVASQPRLGIPQSLDELADMEDMQDASPSSLYERFFAGGPQQVDVPEEDDGPQTFAYEEPTSSLQQFSAYEEPEPQRYSAFEEREPQRYSAFENREPQRYSAFEEPTQDEPQRYSAFEQQVREEPEEVFSAFEQSYRPYEEPEQQVQQVEQVADAPASFFDQLFSIEEEPAAAAQEEVVQTQPEPETQPAPAYKYEAPRSAFEQQAFDDQARSSSFAAQPQVEVAAPVSEPEASPEALSLFERLFAPEEEEDTMQVADVAPAVNQADEAGWSPVRDTVEAKQQPVAQQEPEYAAPVSFFERLFKAELQAEDDAVAAAKPQKAQVEAKAPKPMPRMEDNSSLSVFERLRVSALEDDEQEQQQAVAPAMPQPVPSQPRNAAPLSYFEQMFSSYAEDTNPSSQGWNPILQDFANGSLFDELSGSNLPEEVAAPKGVKSITLDQLERELGARGLMDSFNTGSAEEGNGQSDLKSLLEDKVAAARLMKSFNENNGPPADDDYKQNRDEFSPYGITPKPSNMEVWNDCMRDSC